MMKKQRKPKYTNRLKNETSPYLLQHAHNPIDWYPWGDEAFDKAKKEDKLVLVSIGYAACHWCHVMEKESFEDIKVAKLMNEQFINIKVDREERPDVDHTYMDAVQIMTRSGGWPLNCFTLPDGRPIFGGTYFRKEHWIDVLKQLNDLYKNEKPRVLHSAGELLKGINEYNLIEINTNSQEFTVDQLQKSVENWKPKFDGQYGGTAGAPKFPMPNNLLLLLKYYYFSGDEQVKKHVELTLEKMASSGIYDALGGGFARYSTDEQWRIPHFEKMLYDNAQLISVYANAYRLFKKEQYKNVVFQSIGFIKRELTADNGTFYSAIDADSEGIEGAFYVWKKDETDRLLEDDAEIFNTYYGITNGGNWESGINVLHMHKSIEETAQLHGLNIEEVSVSLKRSLTTLLKARSKRIRPITDDKVLTAWNALTISAFVEAYRTFDNEKFIHAALKAATYFKNHCIDKSGKVYRSIKPKSNIQGFLDDYSLLALSFIDLYQATFDEKWLLISKRMVDYTIENFRDDRTGMFFYSEIKTQNTIINKTELTDNVIPASNSTLANVLYRMGIYFNNNDYRDIALQMLHNVNDQITQYAGYYSNWAMLLTDVVFRTPEIVFTGEHCIAQRKEFDKKFIYANVAGSKEESHLPLLRNRFIKDQSLIYVCVDRSCKLPVDNVKEAIEHIFNTAN